MATHSSILAWKIPWTEEPAGYSPWGNKELDTSKLLTLSTFLHFPHFPLLSTLKLGYLFFNC